MSRPGDDPAVPPRGEPADEQQRSPSHPGQEAIFADPTRRTYLAHERTTLAWWRTALSTLAVAVGVGGILPKLVKLPKGPYVAIGVGYLALSLWFVLVGVQRHRANDRALAERRYVVLSRRMATAMAVYMAVLIAVTGWVLIRGPG
jgi:putative membrane protein